MKKTSVKKVLCIVLSIALIIGIVPVMMASAASASATFAVFSDLHYLADNLYDYNSTAWNQYLETSDREMEQANSIIQNAFDLADYYLEQAKENNAGFVLIPGDLTKDGELESHKQLAQKFNAFEQETGIPVFLVPGNHDIRNSNGRDFKGDKAVAAVRTEPSDFETIYKNFGYDESDPDCISRFHPKDGKLGGGLSYAWKLNDNFMLLGIDSAIYSPDNGAKGDEHLTDGTIGPDLMSWIEEQCAYAKENNLEIVLIEHHNLVPHMEIEEATFFSFVVRDWEYVCDKYADAGIHYAFTGHLHSNDTSSYVNDNGERITDILCPTLTGYPNKVKVIKLTAANGDLTLDMESHEIDELAPVSYVRNGETITYDVPFRKTYSFDSTFGESIEDFALALLKGVVLDYFPQIQEAGGLLKFLENKGIDLQQIIIDALGTNGLEIGDTEILTISQNVMGFIKDFASQVDKKYISNPDYVLDFAQQILHKLLSFKVSDKPCTAIYDEFGFKTDGPTTIGDYARVVIYIMYGGDEDISDDPMMQEVLDDFESGKLAKEFFNLLREVVINDLIENELLSNLNFNPGELFPESAPFHLTGIILQKITEALLGGDNSFMNLVSSILGISLVPDKYSSIDNILDTLVCDEYLTDSQFQGWGHTISWMVSTIAIDSNPGGKDDNTYSITYSGPEEVEATKDNYRLPSNIAVTLSEDASTGAYITWLTKYSVKGTDIQIVPYNEKPDFKNGSTITFTQTASSETVSLSYPGADLGIFGILDYSKDYTRHYLSISNLEPGHKYSYRVGDAARGWWSDPAVLETADKSDKFTFIHLSDMQSQNEKQYETFHSVLKAAFDTAPDAKFIVSSGDQVDLGKNCKLWKYLFNVSSDYLMSTRFMPTTGNHEKEGSIITGNFMLPNVAKDQNLDTGVYYSYDYNNCHFTVLNTNDDEDDKLSDAQIEWLKNDISSSDAKWKIVVLHKALYSNGSHYDDGEVKGFRKQLCALLPFLGVDLVLQGHDHVYLRTDVMNGNLVVPCKEKTVKYNGLEYTAKVNPKGTIYSIPATSGVKIYNVKDASETDKLFPRAEAIVNADNPMFSAIHVDGDTLYYDSYKIVDGQAQRADSFAIEKTGSGAGISASPFGSLIEKILSIVDFTIIWRVFGFIKGLFTGIFN